MKIKKLTKRIMVCVLAFSLVVVGGVIYISNGPYTVNQVRADRVATLLFLSILKHKKMC